MTCSDWAGGEMPLVVPSHQQLCKSTDSSIQPLDIPLLFYYNYKQLDVYLIFCLSGSSLTPPPSCSFDKRKKDGTTSLQSEEPTADSKHTVSQNQIMLLDDIWLLGVDVHVNTELITTAVKNCLPFLSTCSKLLVRQLVYSRRKEIY